MFTLTETIFPLQLILIVFMVGFYGKSLPFSKIFLIGFNSLRGTSLQLKIYHNLYFFNLIDGGRFMIKSMSFLKRKSGITKEEFCNHWKDVHAPIAARLIPGLKRYAQNHPIAIPELESEFDGIAEMWWESMEAAMKYPVWHESDEAASLREDEAKFLDTKRVFRFFAEEHIIK
jgi:uncharacterized protein (TIGR02118 family)